MADTIIPERLTPLPAQGEAGISDGITIESSITKVSLTLKLTKGYILITNLHKKENL